MFLKGDYGYYKFWVVFGVWFMGFKVENGDVF